MKVSIAMYLCLLGVCKLIESEAKTSRKITSGMDYCREDHECGRYGYTYSWCYIDASNNWDYCCEDECRTIKNHLQALCTAGDNYKYWCGSSGNITVTGKRCLANHPCGHHGITRGSVGETEHYWCYYGSRHNEWEKCCNPADRCRNAKDWCYTTAKPTKPKYAWAWQYCTNVPQK